MQGDIDRNDNGAGNQRNPPGKEVRSMTAIIEVIIFGK